MALFSAKQLRSRAQNEIRKSTWEYLSASQMTGKVFSALNESLSQQRLHGSTNIYDIFLSHSSQDAELVQGLKLTFEDMGYSVYIDWIDDPQLNRSAVSKNTAIMLRERMKQSKSLIYAFSKNGSHSKWMPWELGYFDGLKSKASVLPIVEDENATDSYVGSEYVSVYNYVVINGSTMYVHETTTKYVSYSLWLNGSKP